ncbi:tetratricopeptide repeat protein [Patescibacteria group bacterium]
MIYIIALSLLALIVIFVRRYLIVVRGVHLEQMIFNESEKATKGLLKTFHVKRKPKVEHGDKSTQVKIYYTQAMASYENGELAESQEHFEKVYKMDKNFKDASKKLGLIYLKKELFDKAEDIFRDLIVINEEDAVAHSNLGRALYEQKKFQEALEAYLKSIILDSSRAGRFISIAEVYRAMKDNLKAEEMYKKAIDLDSQNVNYLLAFADFQHELGKNSQAKYYLRLALNEDPTNRIALEMLNEIEG